MMRKGFIFGGILCITLLSYLFYHSCKRDTLVIAGIDRISLPDSSWIYGTINLDQIKKDIAWSTLLNGDIAFIFKSDTLSNTLIKLIKSPNAYSIIEQNKLLFFSEWKKPYTYNSLSFKLNGAAALKAAFKSDSVTIEKNSIYSFRTQEGFWMYNASNLIFIAAQIQDSAYAMQLFKHTHSSIIEPIPSDSILVQTIIRTAYLPDSMQHPLLDSARVEIALKQDNEALRVDWTYVGPQAACLTESIITLPSSQTGFFLSCTQTAASMDKMLAAFDPTNTRYKKNQKVFEILKKALRDNRLRVEFNGWKKMKTSYYVSKMNDEFEMVLKKVDTSFIEPLFRCNVEQKNISETNAFLSFLKKEGLISKQGQNNYTLVFGNFDSELRIEKNHSITLENKHKQARLEDRPTTTFPAALYVELKPAYVQGVFDGRIQKEIPTHVIQKLKKIESIRIQVNTNNAILKGNTIIRFNEKKHPIIALMGLLKQ